MNNKIDRLTRWATIILAILLLCQGMPTLTYGQLNTGGTPVSRLHPSGLSAVPVTLVIPPDTRLLARQDSAEPLPYRFAFNIPCPVNMTQTGKWDTLPGGAVICRLGIQADCAKALSILFDRFRIPEGGRLYVYSDDGKQLLGAYTPINNTPSGRFAVQLIAGDHVVLEYNQQNGDAQKPDLHISHVVYAYRGIQDHDPGRGFGGSGPCEVNVNCPEGQDFQQEKNGVVRIQAKKSGSTFWCTGTMLNNTRRDNTPYLLSADHCYKGGTPDDLTQWIFYFTYEAPGCEDPPSPPFERAMTGATLKARAGDVNSGGSDFLLLLLNDPVPDTFDVYLNGWNRMNTPAKSGAGIHHPQGDIKKVSTFNQKASSTSWLGNSVYAHWLVAWDETPNGHGVTEGGSSGSALFDSTGKIVGTLTGGGSSCDSADLNDPDYYGKFSYSWVSCGPDSSAQLKPWLDPDQTGMEILEGKPLAISSPEPVRAFMFYPNPVQGTLTVVFKQTHENIPCLVTLFDSRGITVLNETRMFGGEEEIFDLTSLKPGLYLLRITGPEGSMGRKLIKY